MGHVAPGDGDRQEACLDEEDEGHQAQDHWVQPAQTGAGGKEVDAGDRPTLVKAYGCHAWGPGRHFSGYWCGMA